MSIIEGARSVETPDSSLEAYDSYRTMRFERRGKVLEVRIDWGARNSVDGTLHEELSRVFRDLNADAHADVIVLGGTGRFFCAGGDMDWFQQLIDHREMWRHMIVDAKLIINGLLDLEKPIIAKVNGAAAGLGASVALLSDVIFMAEGASIGDPHVKMGLVAGDGGAIIWPQLIGFARAKELLMTGKMLTAAEASGLGLVNHVIPDDRLDATVEAFAQDLAAGATLAIRWTKTAVNLELKRIATLLSDAALAYETLTNDSADHQEAVHAFKEKRTPVFTGQ